MNPIKVKRIVFFTILSVCSLASLHSQTPARQEIDPLVKASAYGDKSVYSYSSPSGPDKIPIPLPWTLFHPHDFGSAKIVFNGEGVRSVGTVPASGIHPRIFFSPQDLPAIRERIKNDHAAHEAWLNILAYANALKMTYDENADYAKPDRSGWHMHGRLRGECLNYLERYNDPKREDYYSLLADGKTPVEFLKKHKATEFLTIAAPEAYRCLIEDDVAGGKRLAAAVATVIGLEQKRRAAEDKPVKAGYPPNPSTDPFAATNLGLIYDFIYNDMTPRQRAMVHDELVLITAWHDNYGTFNNADRSGSNFATFTYWLFGLMAIQGEPGFNDLKFLGMYRGWRNFFNVSFFDSSAAFEGEGKLLFGLDGVVAMDRVAPQYGLEFLSHHPLIRAHYAKFTALSILPTMDQFAGFDMLGGMGMKSLTTPQDVVVAHYLYPNDATIDYVYRVTVHDDYSELPYSMWQTWNKSITSAIFATSYNPDHTPDKLNLPLTFFCGQRSMMLTRSSWDKNATMLTMHVRGASGGHPYRDRNSIQLSGQGRSWITSPVKEAGGWSCNTVRIDNSDQNETTPARVVDYADTADATFMTGDAKYCWDWVWGSSANSKQGAPLTKDDVLKYNINISAGWKPVEQSFNDFAYTSSERPAFKESLKFRASWIAPDGVIDSIIRHENVPVLKCFRTAGLVRGPRPYVLVVDDVEHNGLPSRYEWNATLLPDVVQVRNTQGLGIDGDIILSGSGSLNADGSLKAGEPALLVRMLSYQGTRPSIEIGMRKNLNPLSMKGIPQLNNLSIRTTAVALELKTLLYAFRMGDPLPVTRMNPAAPGGPMTASVDFPGQKDTIVFAPHAAGKTDVVIKRDGTSVVSLNKGVPPLNDPDSEALTNRLKQLPGKVALLREQSFDPVKQSGFLAGWRFDKIENGAYRPLPGSDPGVQPVPQGDSKPVDGLNGKQAMLIGPLGVALPTAFTTQLTDRPFTISFWFKITESSMGELVNFGGPHGNYFTLFYGPSLSTFGASIPGSILTGWTQITVTSDGKTVKLYHNGLLENSLEKKIEFGKEFKLSGKCWFGDPQAAFAEICFYKTELTPETVENIYLWDKYGAGEATGGRR
jgi:hypothetical protein